MKAALRKAEVPLTIFGAPFGLFISSFAVADYNRTIPAGKLEGFKGAKNPETLRQCLKNLHDSVNTSSSEKIPAYANKCEEVYVLHKLVTERVTELKALDIHNRDSDYGIRFDAVCELEDFRRKMCRRAMIRNSYYMDWFFATMSDNVEKCFLAPMLIMFLAGSILA